MKKIILFALLAVSQWANAQCIDFTEVTNHFEEYSYTSREQAVIGESIKLTMWLTIDSNKVTDCITDYRENTLFKMIQENGLWSFETTEAAFRYGLVSNLNRCRARLVDWAKTQDTVDHIQSILIAEAQRAAAIDQAVAEVMRFVAQISDRGLHPECESILNELINSELYSIEFVLDYEKKYNECRSSALSAEDK